MLRWAKALGASALAVGVLTLGLLAPALAGKKDDTLVWSPERDQPIIGAEREEDEEQAGEPRRPATVPKTREA